MEHEQPSAHEPSSSTAVEEPDGASSSVCISVEESTCDRNWTSVESASDTDDEGYVRTLPGRDIQKYNMGEIKLLEKIGEGGQGTIYTAQLSRYEMNCIISGLQDDVVVAKVYKGRSGQWPEDVFGLHLFNRHVCQFYGYCLEGESFYLLMPKYDCSLRVFLDLLMEARSKRRLRNLFDLLMENQSETRPLSEIDSLMEDECELRPLSDIMTLHLIIYIALGMCFLHENNIIHRDLKADNVFVIVRGLEYGVPPSASIGDFDVASKVVGTLFWRAPEILQALKDGKRPVFTPKADVYSFAMTCYEILTGGVPLEELRASDYDAVLQHGMRPQLPSTLNPKFKNFIERCWHQDPESRPTFKEIVGELKELHKELIIGSKCLSRSFDRIFDNENNYVDKEVSPEACVVDLKALLQALVVKYGQQDFLLLGLEIVGDIENYQSEFGLRSFKEHPVLPFPECFRREKFKHIIEWKLRVFGRIHPNIGELHKIAHLLGIIMSAVHENRTSMVYTDDQLESEEIVSFLEEHSDDHVLPEPRHVACLEGGLLQRCDLCNFIFTDLMKELGPEDLLNYKECLYVEKDLES